MLRVLFIRSLSPASNVRAVTRYMSGATGSVTRSRIVATEYSGPSHPAAVPGARMARPGGSSFEDFQLYLWETCPRQLSAVYRREMDDNDSWLETPNCPVCLARMWPSGTDEKPYWYCPSCKLPRIL